MADGISEGEAENLRIRLWETERMTATNKSAISNHETLCASRYRILMFLGIVAASGLGGKITLPVLEFIGKLFSIAN